VNAAVLYDVDDVRIEHREVPTIGTGELLVRTRASGICSSDLMPWYVRRKAPFVFGHEPAGVVDAVGDGAPPRDADGRPFQVGDRVFVHHHAPCFHCVACRRGDYVQCATWRASAIEPGAMADYFRVPRANVADTLRLGDGVSFADGSLVEPLACVVKSVRRARPRASDTAYVVGLGVMGLLHVALLRAAGVRVLASDYRADRRERALALGAAAVFDARERDLLERLCAVTADRRGAEVVICGPGTAEALQHAIAAAASGGTVLMFTPLEPGMPFPFEQSAAYFRDLSLVASYSCGPDDTRAALAHIENGTITAAKLGATLVPFAEVATAYATMRASTVVKPIVVFGVDDEAAVAKPAPS
jgi:L-iditol 2-dehydrogenase